LALETRMIAIEEAKAIMKAGLGKAELEFVTSLTVPLFWVYREGTRFRSRNEKLRPRMFTPPGLM
jgi:hypothetical protein